MITVVTTRADALNTRVVPRRRARRARGLRLALAVKVARTPRAQANRSSSARSWRVKSSFVSLSSQSSSHWLTSSASSSSAPHSARAVMSGCGRGQGRSRRDRGRDARFPPRGAFRARSRGSGGGVKGVGTRRRAPSLPNSSNSSSHSRSTATFFLGSSFCSVIAFLGARRASGARRPPARDLVLVVGCQTQGTPRKVLRNSSQTEPLEKRSSPILLGRRRRWRTLAPAPSRTRRDARRGGGAAGTAVRSARNPRGAPPAGAAPVDGRSPRRVPRRARVIRSLGAFPGWRARPSVCRAR